MLVYILLILLHFREMNDNEVNSIGLTAIRYFNLDNNENRHLMILTNINNIHLEQDIIIIIQS